MKTINFTAFPELKTERLILRQLKNEDESEIFLIRSDERVNRFLDRQKAKSLAEARDFINKINAAISNNESVYWAITLRDSPALIGTICFWNILWENSIAEIGYELMPDQQGKGFMQESISRIIEYGFQEMHLRKIDAYPSADNASSVKLLEKNNFKLDMSNTDRNIHSEELKNIAIYVLAKKDYTVS